MIITTTSTVDGKTIKDYLGVVRGIVVRTPTIKQGFSGGFKSIVGGKNNAYTEMCEATRHEAYLEMVKHAKELKADGIIGVMYDGSHVHAEQNAIEILCYGTAVKFTP